MIKLDDAIRTLDNLPDAVMAIGEHEGKLLVLRFDERVMEDYLAGRVVLDVNGLRETVRKIRQDPSEPLMLAGLVCDLVPVDVLWDEPVVREVET